NPDVVLVALREPIARALRTIEILNAAEPQRAIIAMTSSSEKEATRKAVRAGARDYLVMPVSRDELERAIIDVHEAETKRAHLGSAENRKSVSQGQIIVVFGAKGGIGKTTLSVNLAAAVVIETKTRVVLVDLDVQMGDVALMLDVEPQHSVADAARMGDRLEPNYLESLVVPDSGGVYILASPANPEHSAEINGQQVGNVLDVLVRTFDYVIVDTAPTFNDLNVAAIERATITLIVTAPEISSVKRTKLSLGLLHDSFHYPEERLKLVVNAASPVRALTDLEIEASLGMPVFWSVPNDQAVAEAVRQARSVVRAKPSARISKNVAQLARLLAGVKEPAGGLFGMIRRAG
ncbi:MAG TPA: AAA family ATPase, partial [Chloroflexota bacterium]|nr:AAA family ATPase [Chloroflexota bacterium]